ncbi:MAG TPA: antirestriction protein ArdA, partial [Candidatus Ruthenibacterium avium]|nr:antirestriction protein ArdA [Candidatus Ruthenibacterium avium]
MYENIISAYVTNLGKYNEGELVGQWLRFPATQEKIRNVLREIGIDGVQYEEIFITDYESDICGLTDCFGEYESLYALNLLAEKIAESSCAFEVLEALLELGECTGSIEELIALIDHTDCFLMYTEVENDYDLGYYYIHEMGLLEDIKESTLSRYIDYEAYGRDVRIEEG